MITLEKVCELAREYCKNSIIVILENKYGYLISVKDADISPTYINKRTGKISNYFPPDHSIEELKSFKKVKILKGV